MAQLKTEVLSERGEDDSKYTSGAVVICYSYLAKHAPICNGYVHAYMYKTRQDETRRDEKRRDATSGTLVNTHNSCLDD